MVRKLYAAAPTSSASCQFTEVPEANWLLWRLIRFYAAEWATTLRRKQARKSKVLMPATGLCPSVAGAG